MVINFDATPFQEMMGGFNKSLTYTAVTKTTSNIRGEETLTDGSPSTISGDFYRQEDDWVQQKEGLFQGADAIVMVLPSVTLEKEAKITYDGEIFRIGKVITRKLGTTEFYKMGRLFKIGDSEIAYEDYNTTDAGAYNTTDQGAYQVIVE